MQGPFKTAPGVGGGGAWPLGPVQGPRASSVPLPLLALGSPSFPFFYSVTFLKPYASASCPVGP